MVFPSSFSTGSSSSTSNTGSSSTSHQANDHLRNGRKVIKMTENDYISLANRGKPNQQQNLQTKKKRVPVKEPALWDFSKDDDDDEVLENQRVKSSDSYYYEIPLVEKVPFDASFSSSATKKRRSKLASIEAKSEEVKASSVASTRRMLAFCHEATDAGVKTMEMLATQGDQLHRVDEHLEQMDANLGEARRNIKEMERSCWSNLFTDLCCFACCCNNAPSTPQSTEESDDKKQPESSSSWFTASSLTNLKEKTGAAFGFGVSAGTQTVELQQPKTNSPSRITFAQGRTTGNGGKKNLDPYEAELSANLAGVDEFLGGLRSMALDMDAEIGRQNGQLDQLNVKVAGNWAAVGKASAAINKLINED